MESVSKSPNGCTFLILYVWSQIEILNYWNYWIILWPFSSSLLAAGCRSFRETRCPRQDKGLTVGIHSVGCFQTVSNWSTYWERWNFRLKIQTMILGHGTTIHNFNWNPIAWISEVPHVYVYSVQINRCMVSEYDLSKIKARSYCHVKPKCRLRYFYVVVLHYVAENTF